MSSALVRLGVILAVALSVLVVVEAWGPSSAQAVTCPAGVVEWNTSVPAGDWSVPGNWIGGVIPTGSTDVCIPAGATVTVSGSESARQFVSIGELVIQAAGSLSIGGADSYVEVVDIAGALSLAVGEMWIGVRTLGDGAELQADAGAAISVGGGADLSGAIDIAGPGAVHVSGVASAAATITSVQGGAWVGSLDGGSAGITVHGDWTWPEEGLLAGLVVNEGTISPTGETGNVWRGIVGDFTNNGTLHWETGGSTNGIGVADGPSALSTITNNGAIETLDALRFVDFGFGGTFINHGTIDARDRFTTGTMTVINDGSWVVQTDQGVDVSDPLATSVETPGGFVTIYQGMYLGQPPSDYELVGDQYSVITAADATVADPLIITFTVDGSAWSPPLSSLTVARNGMPVADCASSGISGPADPSPCVGDRSGTWPGPAQVVVRTAQASDWVMIALIPVDTDGDGVVDSDDVCPNTSALGTATPDRLKKNRFAVDDAGDFVDRNGTQSGFTIFDTAGCDEGQIITEAGLGNGHTKFGLSRGALKSWVATVAG